MSTYEEQVAAAANPKEAMLVIARALDSIEVGVRIPTEDTWNAWPTVVQNTDAQARALHEAKLDFNRAAYPAVTVTETEDHTDVALQPPTEERMEQRRQFERQSLKLAEQLNDPDTDWNEAYAIGGPLWLYLANRDLVDSYPYAVKQAMISEVELDSPQDAQEMGRDLLKAPCETGPGSTGMNVG